MHAIERDFPKPAWSAIVEMLLRKGLRAYKLEHKRAVLIGNVLVHSLVYCELEKRESGG